MNSSTENPNTSVESTNIKNCKEESESPTRAVASDSGAVTDSAIDVDDDDRESRSSSLMLTGLHTCGKLAPNIFRIFLANPDARFLCNVGCCYQLLTEEFWTEDGYTKDDNPGFPLSNELRRCGFHLSRKARMLSVQAPQRMDAEGKLPVRSLHWRAVLQVILCEVTGEKRDTMDWQVGKIAPKCKGFVDYVRRCFKKLGIRCELTDEQISDYEQKFEGEFRKVQTFYQIKATLAPCIEALILLDRLAFLQQQECLDRVYLVQMFDPVISPRCYGIIATKR